MEDNQRRKIGIELCQFLYACFEPFFAAEDFCNALQFKQGIGVTIKNGLIGGYRNLECKDYKIVFDLIAPHGQSYHMGIDFGQQAVHVTLGPGDVHSLYYRDPTVSE